MKWSPPITTCRFSKQFSTYGFASSGDTERSQTNWNTKRIVETKGCPMRKSFTHPAARIATPFYPINWEPNMLLNAQECVSTFLHHPIDEQTAINSAFNWLWRVGAELIMQSLHWPQQHTHWQSHSQFNRTHYRCKGKEKQRIMH